MKTALMSSQVSATFKARPIRIAQTTVIAVLPGVPK